MCQSFHSVEQPGGEPSPPAALESSKQALAQLLRELGRKLLRQHCVGIDFGASAQKKFELGESFVPQPPKVARINQPAWTQLGRSCCIAACSKPFQAL